MRSFFQGKLKDLPCELVKLRRHFHKHPELSFKEYKTSEKIKSELSMAGIPFEEKAKTGVVASLGSKNKLTVGLRADMDALPVEEKTGLPFASTNKGVMHACGHDGHITALLGVARILKEYQDELKVNARFIFQPSEESINGGAALMVEEGILRDIDFMLGFHYLPFLPLYRIDIGEGPVMASSDYFRILVKGRSGHGAAPHSNKDPVVCAAYLLTAFQTIVSRVVDPLKPAVLTVGKFSAGQTFNITPESVEMLGTVRTLCSETRSMIREELISQASNISKAFGCKTTVDYKTYSGVCMNDVDLARNIKDISKKKMTGYDIGFTGATMLSEDFSFFSEKVPSCYLFIGVGEECGVNHNEKFSIDERILPFTATYFSELILNLSKSLKK